MYVWSMATINYSGWVVAPTSVFTKCVGPTDKTDIITLGPVKNRVSSVRKSDIVIIEVQVALMVHSQKILIYLVVLIHTDFQLLSKYVKPIKIAKILRI